MSGYTEVLLSHPTSSPTKEAEFVRGRPKVAPCQLTPKLPLVGSFTARKVPRVSNYNKTFPFLRWVEQMSWFKSMLPPSIIATYQLRREGMAKSLRKISSLDLMVVGDGLLIHGGVTYLTRLALAGTVIAVGPSVTSFKPGDNVVTHMTPHLPADVVPDFPDIRLGMGQIVDGPLSTHGIFEETALVRMPSSLTFDQACTLSCSGLTAYNALFGLPSHAPAQGSWVLVQGTGGVSIAALQFAVAVGANVIATTSSDVKKKRLEALGAKHVLNYRTDPRWGETAKSLTPGKVGVDVVVDVGGLSTLGQSLKATRVDGLVSACGLLGSTPDGEETPNVLSVLMNGCIVRGVLLGSRTKFEEMCRWIEEVGVKPVVDDRIFKFKEVQEAYRFVDEQKHFSKIVIRISQ
jgi:NADPH:quinone reductase-like Zn-dependent oxidoreductase